MPHPNMITLSSNDPIIQSFQLTEMKRGVVLDTIEAHNVPIPDEQLQALAEWIQDYLDRKEGKK